ncbi:hypothetical protein Tco_1002517 [Tanacetum coccineum]|uniref:Uncharacterized protein n=1 Tax=Tanacetum coccineum TaxID=301880 RepID=A0ABQ5F7K6_9ASTR
MASLDYRLNPLFSIKECSPCGALYTVDFCCSKGGLKDKILLPKPPHNCTTCGDPVDGLYCQHCAFVRKCLNEGWYTIHDENEILNTSESSNDNTNILRRDFLRLNQSYEREQNQPEYLWQELILKLMDDLQILKSQQEKKETASQSFIPYWNFSMIDDEEARDNFLKDVCTFLRNWNRPTFYDNDDDEYTIIYSKPKAITPDLPIEEPDNSLSMGDEHLDTIPSVRTLPAILSELEDISDDTCDVPECNETTFTTFSNPLFDSNDDFNSSDDESLSDKDVPIENFKIYSNLLFEMRNHSPKI